jgi:pyrroline-5-carboxylate reductase
MESRMRVGFIGTGHLTEAVITGFFRSGEPPKKIVVSPRNAQRAKRIVLRHGASVEIGKDNQAVLDTSDVVCLALRPQVAGAILRDLEFRNDHTIVSFMAMVPIKTLRDWVNPKARLVRAATLPYAAHATGPSIFYPKNQDVEALLGKVGTPVLTQDEQELEIIWVITSMMASYFQLIADITSWASQKGADIEKAGKFTSSMFGALSTLCEDHLPADFNQLIANSQTEDGINQQALRSIKENGGFQEFIEALERVRIRLEA